MRHQNYRFLSFVIHAIENGFNSAKGILLYKSSVYPLQTLQFVFCKTGRFVFKIIYVTVITLFSVLNGHKKNKGEFVLVYAQLPHLTYTASVVSTFFLEKNNYEAEIGMRRALYL